MAGSVVLVTGANGGLGTRAAGVAATKLDPAEVVRIAYDGLEAGLYEILADDLSRHVKRALAGPVEGLYPQLADGAGA